MGRTGRGKEAELVKGSIAIYIAALLVLCALAGCNQEEACYVHYPEHTSRWESCRVS